MKSLILAVVLYLFALSVAQAQYYVPNQAYGNYNGGYTYVTPQPLYYYYPSYGGYGGGYGGYNRSHNSGLGIGYHSGYGPGGYYSGSSITNGPLTTYSGISGGKYYSGSSYRW